MLIETASNHFNKSHATDVTATSFTLLAPSATSPAANDGVIPWGRGGSVAPNLIHIIPYGKNAQNLTGTIRVWTWSVFSKATKSESGVSAGDTVSDLWVPTLACVAALTLCSTTGVANTPVGTAYFFCDSIVLGTGFSANVSNECTAPGSELVAHMHVDVKGARYVQIEFSTDSSSTALNSLYRGY